MNSITIKGVEGSVYWHYQPAGSFRGWSVTRTSPADYGTLTATVVNVDTYRVSQRPLVFVVQHEHGSWRWPIETLQIEGDTLTARLGPKESSDALPFRAT